MFESYNTRQVYDTPRCARKAAIEQKKQKRQGYRGDMTNAERINEIVRDTPEYGKFQVQETLRRMHHEK
jgi:hypothetical protein